MTFDFSTIFAVGQRVRYLGDRSLLKSEIDRGEEGTIVDIIYVSPETKSLAVDWDRAAPRRHNCDGAARNEHGWCVPMDTVTLI